MLKRILTILGDKEYSAAATRHAMALAKAHGAEVSAVSMLDVDRLTDVGAVPLGGSGAAIELRESRIEQTRQIIDETVNDFRRTCDLEGCTCDVRTVEGDPFVRAGIVARYYDVVVVGLRNTFEHGVIDEPTDELMHLVEEGIRPLLAVASPYRPVRRVLVCYSGSAASAKTMRRFAQLRLYEDIELRVVTFRTPHDDPARALADATRYFRAHGYDPETEFVDEPAKSNLLPYADRWDADVIVLGNSAKKTLLRKMFGETALQAMREAQRTLFLSQ